jgi:magnesium chelatase family protein
MSLRNLDLNDASESSAGIRERVVNAREIQSARFLGSGIFANAQMQLKETKKYCVLIGDAFGILKTAVEKLNFSARFYDKILKVQELDGRDVIKTNHIAKAVRFCRNITNGNFKEGYLETK